ncbi:transcriptional regulator [Plantactinospora sp. S1510]|uniref:Transcriptional regulator n=1 Tax=Plantactinospora alkalitolerans TaxID=2789879 RepID=A0ABS0GUJ6_9ACTN|nr:transcriptional regulator [Plantactinospora alkalitolerans]MBF9129866.1 transcriptional regulator [Plantactinospora alkalitolerans]
MGIWRIGTDSLARSRFTVSALAETVAALKSLHTGIAAPGQRDWLAAHTPGYRERVAADPFARALVRAAFRPRWMADLLTRPPAGPDETIADELARIRATPPGTARADLAGGPDAPLPAELAAPDLPERTVELLGWIWTRTVEPDWSRRRRILEADIVSRTQQLSSGGWAATLDRMRPGMRWLGDGRLQVNPYDLPAEDLTGAELLFIPSTTHRGWLGSAGPDRHAVFYPCTGSLADPADRQPTRALSRLLGPVRAGILTLLETPKSPTQLVALTGHGYGSVGGHLQVLLDAQLVRRRRSGRSVLYFRTPGGDLLVGAQHRDAAPPDPDE